MMRRHVALVHTGRLFDYLIGWLEEACRLATTFAWLITLKHLGLPAVMLSAASRGTGKLG